MTVLVVAIFCGVLVLNIWALLIRSNRPWSKKFSVVLEIVGGYALVFGLLAQTAVVPKDAATELTSPNLFSFLAGNADLMSRATAAMSLALTPEKTSFGAFAIVQLFWLLPLSAVAFAYALFYAFVVAPLSYVAYVLVSMPVDAVVTSGKDMLFTIGDQTISIQKSIAASPVAIKNFLISCCAFSLKMAIEFISAHRQTSAEPWSVRHRRLARAGLLGGQIVLGWILFTLIVGAILVPWTIDRQPEGAAGEIVGAEIVTALVVWGGGALLMKARRVRRALARQSGEPVAAVS